MAITTVIANPGFEEGDTGWEKGYGVTIGTYVPGIHTGPRTGSYYAGRHSKTSGSGDTHIWNENKAAVVPGQVITARCWGSGEGHNGNAMAVQLQWQDASGNELLVSRGEESPWNSPGGWYESKVTAVAPSGAAFVRIGAFLRIRKNGGAWVDDFSWSYVNNRSIDLVTPADGATFVQGNNVKLSVLITGTSPDIVKVEYYDGDDPIGAISTPNYIYNTNELALGTHAIKARLYLVDGTQSDSPVHNIEIVPYVPPPELREFKASNSYVTLVTGNFYGLSSGMPPTALVTGVEIELTYSMELLVRSKDVDVDDPLASNSNVIFDITDGGSVETVLLSKNSAGYSKLGNSVVQQVPIDLIDFSQTESGKVSDGKKWTVFTSSSMTATLGASDNLYGQDPIPASDFVNYYLGLRFYPNLLSFPDYADSGDACVRFKINKYRVKVYFNAGSVDYYFVSPDKTKVIKGKLVNSYVFSGNIKTGDATGILELIPDLEVVDGDEDVIGKDWTIHSGYPATDANKIADVVESDEKKNYGMAYNGLPTYKAIINNRSRYEMISHNFYGDVSLYNIYGVNGVSRAFTYNDKYFHYIFTQPDPELDKPRHVSHHHSHLALGYDDGRVDISVVGEPYNYSGVDGASSWAIGDPVVGLLPLSGALLGVFCTKSIWGISGTTVDNFATQIISPKLGAIEYTITDMGIPVYANIYGIYTLAQTSQYGDFAGTPMSQAVSPWLRPRLIRSDKSNYEVVAAWPVRSKNQYRLAFADGYVLTMTMNNGMQDIPTFSKQKYFLKDDTGTATLYDTERPALVPIAISSELDDTGHERIHTAHKVPVPVPPCVLAKSYAVWGGSGNNDGINSAGLVNVPEWLNTADSPTILVDFFDDANYLTYQGDTYGWWTLTGSPTVFGVASGHGTIYSADMSNSVCFDWQIPEGV